MIRRTIIIDDKTLTVPSREAFADLKEAVTAAVLHGGGLIDLPGPSRENVSFTVLMTPYRRVTFDEREIPDDNDNDTEDVFADFDFDFDFDFGIDL